MSRKRITINVVTGEKTVEPYTEEENSKADADTAAELERNEVQILASLKRDAEGAELRASVDVMKGNTPEAVAYRAEKERQKK